MYVFHSAKHYDKMSRMQMGTEGGQFEFISRTTDTCQHQFPRTTLILPHVSTIMRDCLDRLTNLIVSTATAVFANSGSQMCAGTVLIIKRFCVSLLLMQVVSPIS